MSSRHRRRCVTALVVAVVLVASVAAPAVAQEPSEPSFVVTLHEGGDAEVALTLTFDLTTDGERAAFEELRDNETARQASTERFASRLSAVADDAGDRTGREMSVAGGDVRIRTEDGGDQGVVIYTATWTNLAATDGEELTVTEPFASGFQPDRTFRLVGPEGATLEDATPRPATEDGATITYGPGADLDGFEATFETAGDGVGTSSDDGSGFGLGVAVAALAAALVGLARR